MKRLYQFIGILSVVILLGGCSPFALVNSEVYNDANLAEYKTFRIVTPDMGKLPEGMQMVTYYNIAAAIRQEMVMRGYSEDPSSPLLINIAVTTHREIATEPLVQPGYFPYYGAYYPSYIWPRSNYGPYWGARPLPGAPVPPPGRPGAPVPPPPAPLPPAPAPVINPNVQVITGIYKEGVLTMDFVNTETKLPLYSASVATIIDNGSGQYRNLKSIAEAVNTLFSKFPVKVLPQYRD